MAGDAESFARTLAAALDAPAFSYSERFSAWRIVCEGGHVDVAPLRGPTIADDLRGRDFTVNAMARALRRAKGPAPRRPTCRQAPRRPTCRSASAADARRPVDPCGGLADLRARRLVPCAPGAFDDDPVRVVRLARLRHELDLMWRQGSSRRPRAAAGRLAAASAERLEHELSSLLGLPCVAPAVRSLADLGALEVVLPEVAACRGVTQNPYHHLDVFEHTLEALSFLPQVVAALGGERYLATPEECGLPGAPAAGAARLGRAAARRRQARGAPGRRRRAGDVLLARSHRRAARRAASAAGCT